MSHTKTPEITLPVPEADYAPLGTTALTGTEQSEIIAYPAQPGVAAGSAELHTEHLTLAVRDTKNIHNAGLQAGDIDPESIDGGVDNTELHSGLSDTPTAQDEYLQQLHARMGAAADMQRHKL